MRFLYPEYCIVSGFVNNFLQILNFIILFLKLLVFIKFHTISEELYPGSETIVLKYDQNIRPINGVISNIWKSRVKCFSLISIKFHLFNLLIDSVESGVRQTDTSIIQRISSH